MPDIYVAKPKSNDKGTKVKTTVVDINETNNSKQKLKKVEKKLSTEVGNNTKRIEKTTEPATIVNENVREVVKDEGFVDLMQAKMETKIKEVKDFSEVMRNEKRTTNPFAAFMVRPQQLRVDIQDSEEVLLLVLRKHIITNVPWLMVTIIMLLAPVIFSFIPIFNFLPPRFMMMALVLWYLLTLGIALEGFLSWYFNVYIITDERIIDVDFVNLLYKNISSAKIDKIEDVTVEMTGALQSLLNYGTIFIQTAAEKTEFEFTDVPQPQKVAKFINEMILQEEQEVVEGRVK